MAIAASFPSIKPSLSLDFANVGALDPRVTFTRSTTGTYYDGVTTAKAEENLLTYSQEFDNAAWTKTRSSVTANSTTAPDGTSTAETLVEDTTAADTHFVQELLTTAVATYTLSVFAKYLSSQWITLSLSVGSTTWAAAKFDVQNGVAGSTSQSGAGWSASASSITSVGGGWYRCVVTVVSNNAVPGGVNIFTATDGTTFAANKNGGESFTGTSRGVYIWGAQLEQRSSVTAYTPTTSQPITNYIPVLQTAAAGQARFDHNPTTGEALGLLIEEQRTNLQIRSEALNNSTWDNATPSIPTRTAAATIAPNGTQTAFLLTASTGGVSSQIRALTNTTSVLGTQFTASFYVKQYDSPRTSFILFDTTSGFSSIATLAVTWSDGVPSVAVSSGTYNILSIGNGWYRLSITGSSLNTNAQLMIALQPDSQSGSGTKSIFAWGAQLEAGAFPTSYIPTTSAQVTRNADAASMTGTNFSSWYNAGEGTMYADFVTSAPASVAAAAFAISNGSIDQMINTYVQGAMVQQVRNTSTQASLSPSGSFSAGVLVKSAIAAAINDFAGSANGGSVATDTLGVMPQGVDRLQIGSNGAVTVANVLNGTIKKIAYYPQRLTNAQLQALTS